MSTPAVEEKGPATGSAAFAAARASIASAPSEPAPDDTPTQQPPVEEPASGADQPPEPPEDQDALLELPEEEVKKLSLRDQKVYRALQKQYTQSRQELSALKKNNASWQPLIDAMTADPDRALQQMAQERGFSLSKVNQDTRAVEAQTEKALDRLSPELQFLRPIFQEVISEVREEFRKELTPVRETVHAVVSEAAAAETQGMLESFTTKYPEWKKHEPAMLALAQKFTPAKGAMTDFEYMENLYHLATRDIQKAEQVKETVARINRAAAAAEPSQTSGIPANRVEHVLPPEGRRDIRAAWEAAKRGERWTK